MNGSQHCVLYSALCFIFVVIVNFTDTIPMNLRFAFSLWVMFLINPDLDLLFRGAHRNFITHSFILPFSIYLAIRTQIFCTDLNYPVLSLMFFFPVIAHLIGDLGCKTKGGFWLINFRPFSNRSLPFKWSLAWLLLNILLMLTFIILQFLGLFAISGGI